MVVLVIRAKRTSIKKALNGPETVEKAKHIGKVSGLWGFRHAAMYAKIHGGQRYEFMC
ncbi:hypothetical protein SAMN05421740_111125 [Parapedobacter koreensis]|uniref:Uncharacterized protein n=1 Tax=Parapedobacter koreensis TaxID=332977 RepID=A0A1H7TKQ8_9SPHI|nr:hypothetical protein SAMN05421740_111125 [Parapedobacter koreensis]